MQQLLSSAKLLVEVVRELFITQSKYSRASFKFCSGV